MNYEITVKAKDFMARDGMIALESWGPSPKRELYRLLVGDVTDTSRRGTVILSRTELGRLSRAIAAHRGTKPRRRQ